MSILSELVSSNNYPIVFVGSGISKRYLDGFPSWEELGFKENFYSFLSNQKEDVKDKNLSETEKSFLANTAGATKIKNEYNKQFREGKVTLDNLTVKDAYQKNLCPFKVAVANHFNKYSIKKDINTEEFEFFIDLLVNSRIIVTTNYDTLIEDMLIKRDSPAKVFIGQKGFFDPYEDWAELYKIHGSITETESIVIDSDDYDNYDKNSILISAKILSNLIHSPIIFLGYSMTDRNVRKLLSDFSSQLPPEDTRKTANRIIVVEYEPGKNDIEETQIQDPETNMNYTHIKTDNYLKIFKSLAEIDEGLTPFEVRKYNSVIKKLVIASGEKGALETVLLSPSELDNISDQIDQGKPIVLAIGDTKHIFLNPTATNYIEDYILEKNEIFAENALRFIAKEGANTKYPFIRHYNRTDLELSNLDNWDIERINKKIQTLKHTDLKALKNSINKSNRIKVASIDEVLNSTYPYNKKIDIITYNAASFNYDSFTEFVKETALPDFISVYKKRMSKDGMLKSAYRRLFLMWDILTHGEIH